MDDLMHQMFRNTGNWTFTFTDYWYEGVNGRYSMKLFIFDIVTTVWNRFLAEKFQEETGGRIISFLGEEELLVSSWSTSSSEKGVQSSFIICNEPD